MIKTDWYWLWLQAGMVSLYSSPPKPFASSLSLMILRICGDGAGDQDGVGHCDRPDEVEFPLLG